MDWHFERRPLQEELLCARYFIVVDEHPEEIPFLLDISPPSLLRLRLSRHLILINKRQLKLRNTQIIAPQPIPHLSLLNIKPPGHRLHIGPHPDVPNQFPPLDNLIHQVFHFAFLLLIEIFGDF